MRGKLLMLAGAVLVCGCVEDRGASTLAGPTRAGIVPVSGLPAYFDCLDEQGITLVSAHRGTDGRMPENALASIEAVVARTNGLVEVDVATSSDGVLYLHHDDTLNRTTSGRGPADASWSIIKDLSLRDDRRRMTAYTPTTLHELLVWSEGRAIPQLDIKRSTRYDDVAAVLEETDAEARVVVIAYSEAQVRLIARKMPAVMISAPIDALSDIEELERNGVALERLLAWTGRDRPDPDLFRALDERGVQVIFGTLGGQDSADERIRASGDDSTYATLAKAGVDILATDRPVEAAVALMANGIATNPTACYVGDETS